MGQPVKQIDVRPPAAEPAAGVDVSVVVPVAERCDDLTEVYRVHAAVLERLGRSFEFLFVVDPGFEREVDALDDLARRGARLRVIRMPRPFGEAAALVVGFKEARSEVILTLPAYFQTAADGVEAVLRELEAGADLVVGRRWPRTDPWVNRAQNRALHAITRRSTGVDLHDVSCGLRALRRGVTREVRPYGDLHRFLPLLAAQRGFRVTEVDVPQHPADRRTRIKRPDVYVRRLLDVVTLFFLLKFIRKPLRFFGLIGAGIFGAGVLICIELVVEKFAGGIALVDRPMLILGVLLMVLGVQIGSIGLLGEIIIFTHSRRMREYTIREVLR